MDTKKYIDSHRERFFNELFSLLRIPSISALPEHRKDMQLCAERWRDLLLEAGADRAEVMPTSASPVVFAEKIVDRSFPTVLVYAHYDVMPVEPLELWHTEPFEPVVKDGKLWARGADDDKGQGFIQLKAFEIAVKEGLLRCNVKFLIEGGPNRDLHSGIFGGTVANPINELCKMLAGVVDENGCITLPHFYDKVETVSAQERAMLGAVPYDEEKYKAAIDVEALSGEIGYSPLERTAIRPTFDICGIWGGYTGEGAKTVLPSKAYAKVSCRLVPHQNHEEISKMFIDYIYSVAPRSVKVKVSPMHGGESYVCPINLPAYRAAEKGYELAFGKRPLAVRRGGSIPIIATFEKVLGVKSVLMGFGLESDATHSPNENFLIEMYEKGIIAVVEFYNQFGH